MRADAEGQLREPGSHCWPPAEDKYWLSSAFSFPACDAAAVVAAVAAVAADAARSPFSPIDAAHTRS